MNRVIALTNFKGGVGKTTLAANLLGQLAEAGYKVLGIDLNVQANLVDDLGARSMPGVDDNGEGLYEAIRRPDRNTLQAHEVRPGLWIVPGGEELIALTPLITTKTQTEGRDASLSLAAAISAVADDYDIIIIDSPPENVPLLDLTLAAAAWALMPTRSDPGGLRGMQLTARRFTAAREVNPSIKLLGAVLFGSLSTATAIHREIRAEVAEAFGGDSPMFAAFVRHNETFAANCRRWGKLAHELEVADGAAREQLIGALSAQGLTSSGRRLLTRRPRKTSGEDKANGTVASDYRDVAMEMLQIISVYEQAIAEDQEGEDPDE